MRTALRSVLFLLVLLTPIACNAQSGSSPRAFLERIFRSFDNHGKGSNNDRRYFSASLNRLIERDIKAVGTDIPYVGDADLICGCQEWDGFWVQSFDVNVVSPGHVEAVVSYYLYAPEARSRDDLRKTKYILVEEKGRWKIDEIISFDREGKVTSLRQEIEKELEFYRQQAAKSGAGK